MANVRLGVHRRPTCRAGRTAAAFGHRRSESGEDRCRARIGVGRHRLRRRFRGRRHPLRRPLRVRARPLRRGSRARRHAPRRSFRHRTRLTPPPSEELPPPPAFARPARRLLAPLRRRNRREPSRKRVQCRNAHRDPPEKARGTHSGETVRSLSQRRRSVRLPINSPHARLRATGDENEETRGSACRGRTPCVQAIARKIDRRRPLLVRSAVEISLRIRPDESGHAFTRAHSPWALSSCVRRKAVDVLTMRASRRARE